MTVVNREFAIVSIRFVGTYQGSGFDNTYDRETGGPLDYDYAFEGNEISDYIADDIMPSAVLIPQKALVVSSVFRDPELGIPIGAKGNLVFTILQNDRTDATQRTFKNMVAVGERGGMTKSTPAQGTQAWVYEGDGAAPISKTTVAYTGPDAEE